MKGHRTGDLACKGKEGEVHRDAPEWFRKQSGSPQKGGRGRGNGKGKGKGKQKGGGMRGKPLCQNWSKGTGYCRYATACKFAHDGPQGRGHAALLESDPAMLESDPPLLQSDPALCKVTRPCWKVTRPCWKVTRPCWKVIPGPVGK